MTSDSGSDSSPGAPEGARQKDRRKPTVPAGSTLAARDNIFFAAVQTTRMPMIVTDPTVPDNPIVFANDAFLAMTGYEADEIVGTNCRFLQGPDTDRATIDELREAIAARREFATEILNYRKDGYSFWNALFVSPVFDEDGQLIYFFGSQLDISRRREAEDKLRQTEKMDALGRLTGGIAHDFNNLLQVMVGYLELIDSGLGKPQPDFAKLRRSIGNARNAADRAASLTQQLLAFSRKQRLQGRVLNLNDLATSIRELADRTLGDDVAVETTLDEALPNCRIDPAQVEVALLNILINARDAMVGRPDKKVVIETRRLTVNADRMTSDGLPQGRYASIAVRDSGTGMPAHVIERVMDPFFTTKEEGKGTGLGLSMVYGFAKQSGGIAKISSTEGAGTTVSIFFPAVDDAVSRPERRGGSALERPGDETILVVEDRPDVSELVRVILKDFGYKVLHAKDGDDALRVLAANPDVDLLFSDLIMPGNINGVTLAREARRRNPALKVLLTTGYAEASIERTDAGGWEFDVLDKPYGRMDLARKIRVILDGPTGIS